MERLDKIEELRQEIAMLSALAIECGFSRGNSDYVEKCIKLKKQNNKVQDLLDEIGGL